MNNLIAFTGGCFSGKTSSIKKVIELHGEENCVFLSEIMRKKFAKEGEKFSISELRKNPKKYFEVQKEIITQKFNEEVDAANNPEYKGKKVLIDRCMTDSLFYLTHYVDKSSFTEEEKKEYNEFVLQVIEYVKKSALHYTKVLEFCPVEGINTDNYRPVDIDTVKYVEHEFISALNNNFYSGVIQIDLNKDNFTVIASLL